MVGGFAEDWWAMTKAVGEWSHRIWFSSHWRTRKNLDNWYGLLLLGLGSSVWGQLLVTGEVGYSVGLGHMGGCLATLVYYYPCPLLCTWWFFSLQIRKISYNHLLKNLLVVLQLSLNKTSVNDIVSGTWFFLMYLATDLGHKCKGSIVCVILILGLMKSLFLSKKKRAWFSAWSKVPSKGLVTSSWLNTLYVRCMYPS